MSTDTDVVPDPVSTYPAPNNPDISNAPPTSAPSDMPDVTNGGSFSWDSNGFVDLSDTNRYPFVQPEWGHGFYITQHYDFSPFIAAAIGILALAVASWFIWNSFRKQVAAVEALGDNAVEPAPETLKAKKRDKLITAIISGAVALSLLMTGILSVLSVLDLRGSQVDDFGKWAAERYPTALISRAQAETLLTGQSVFIQQAGYGTMASLELGYDGGYYLVAEGSHSEVATNGVPTTAATNPDGSNAPTTGTGTNGGFQQPDISNTPSAPEPGSTGNTGTTTE
jgi:hypothetical protein